MRVERKLQRGSEVFDLRRTSREVRLRLLLENQDRWLQTCAAVSIGDAGLLELSPQIEPLLKSQDPVCRETAIGVLKKLLPETKLSDLIGPLAEDEHPRVRAYANFVLSSPA